MRKFLLTAAIVFMSLGAISYAYSAERTDCQPTSYSTLISANKDVPEFQVKELSPELLANLFNAAGTPPVATPYTIDLATATVDEEPMGLLIVHDGECLLTKTTAMPINEVRKLLGLVEARG